MSACQAPEGQLADGRLRLAARPVRQPPAPIISERQEEHHRPRLGYKNAALLAAAAGDAAAGLSRQTFTISGGAVLHKEKTVAAALRLAGHITKPIYSENGR